MYGNIPSWLRHEPETSEQLAKGLRCPVCIDLYSESDLGHKQVRLFDKTMCVDCALDSIGQSLIQHLHIQAINRGILKDEK